MKNITTRIAALCLGILILGSCSKDSTSFLPESKTKATIDGASWNSTTQVAYKNITGFIITATQISTTSLTTSTLVFTLVGSGTGDYDVLSTSTKHFVAIYTPNISEPTATFTSTKGTVSLTEIDTANKTISGTFNFTCASLALVPVLKTVSSGTFTKISYQESSAK